MKCIVSTQSFLNLVNQDLILQIYKLELGPQIRLCLKILEKTFFPWNIANFKITIHNLNWITSTNW